MRADLAPEDLHNLAHDCALLAQLFAYGNAADFIAPLSQGASSLSAYFPRTAAALADAGEEATGGEILLAQLEHARLLAPSAPEAVCPQERAYRSTAENPADFYALHNFTPPFAAFLALDHLSCQLSFAQYLCQQIADNNKAVICAEDLEQFAEKHLLTWIKEFCDDLKDAAESNFWIDVAQLLRATMNTLR